MAKEKKLEEKAENTTRKQFKDQYEGEEVLLVFRKHPVVMRRGLIYFMIAILVGTIPSFLPNAELSYFYYGIGGGLLLGLLLWFPSWIYWYFTVNIMTSQRFIQVIQRGFFNRTVSDIGIKHIQSVNYQVAGIQETVLGYGSIMIQTYLGDIMIHDVHHPQAVMNELFKVLREYGDVHEPMVDDEIAAKAKR